MNEVSVDVVVWLAIGGTIVLGSLGLLASDLRRRLARSADDRALIASVLGNPPTRIGDVREGDWVRIVGSIEGAAEGAAFRTPLSGAWCVGHRTRLMLDGGDSGVPTQLADELLVIGFIMADSSGRARVAARRARMALELVAVHPSSYQLGVMLERHGFGREQQAGVLCREAHVGPGDRVSVVGRARWEDDPTPAGDRVDASYRGNAAPRRLVIEASELGPVLITNAPEAVRPARAG